MFLFLFEKKEKKPIFNDSFPNKNLNKKNKYYTVYKIKM